MKSGETVKPKVLSVKKVFKGVFFNVTESKLEYPGKKIATFHVPGFNDIVAVVPVEGKDVYLVNEWRYAWGKEVLQLPAGQCPYKTEAGRIKQVRNELREEIGMDARKIVKLSSNIMSSNMKFRVHVYLATGLFRSEKAPDDHEFIQILRMPFEDALKKFTNGKSDTTGYTILGMLLAKAKLKSK